MRRSLGALALLLAHGGPAPAQQGEPIGSWWLLSDPAGVPAIMTLSTQGSGVIAFRCAAGRPSMVIGLNRQELRLDAGAAVTLGFQIGAGERRRVEGRVSGEVVEVGEPVSDEVMRAAGDAPSFTVHLPQAGAAELSLVFRPVETAQAMDRLRKACAKSRSKRP